MRSITRGNFRVARAALRSNRWRSFLTMLGIIIGVSSVITVVSIGQGIKQQVAGQINHVGRDLITVRPGHVDPSSVRSLANISVMPASGSLSNKDVAAIQKTPGVATAVPLSVIGGAIKGDNGDYSGGPVIATSPELPAILNQSVAFGSFFSTNDNGDDVAILGQDAATKLFSAQVPLGQTFSFRGHDFMVRGILNEFASAPLAADIDFNNAIFIPSATAQELTNSSAVPYEILTKPVLASQTAKTAAAINASLLKVHGDSQDFSVLQQSQTLAQTTGVLNLLTQLITSVAAISLLVGGIGIMNIMLVSVTERLHEIGIRKAVGATNRQILSEFMAEATMLSVIGSLVGIGISLVINLVLRILTDLTPVVDWKIIVLASGISIIVGILFGTAPALKAARKDPIAALRGE
jgi:putative ABC transport system permease protein